MKIIGSRNIRNAGRDKWRNYIDNAYALHHKEKQIKTRAGSDSQESEEEIPCKPRALKKADTADCLAHVKKRPVRLPELQRYLEQVQGALQTAFNSIPKIKTFSACIERVSRLKARRIVIEADVGDFYRDTVMNHMISSVGIPESLLIYRVRNYGPSVVNHAVQRGRNARLNGMRRLGCYGS